MSLSHFIYNPNCSSPMLEQLYNCYLFLSVGYKMLHRKLMTDYIQFDHKLIIGYIELHL